MKKAQGNEKAVLLLAIILFSYLYFFVLLDGFTLSLNLAELSDKARYSIAGMIAIIGAVITYR